MKGYVRWLSAAWAACAVWFLLAGCAGVPRGPSIPVRMVLAPDGTVTFRGQRFSAEETPVHLKKAGVRPEQPLQLSTSSETRWVVVQRLTTALMKNGYGKIRFVTEKRASSEASEDKAAP